MTYMSYRCLFTKKKKKKKKGPWDLCWFKRLKVDLLCFFAIGCNFVNLLLANLNCELKLNTKKHSSVDFYIFIAVLNPSKMISNVAATLFNLLHKSSSDFYSFLQAAANKSNCTLDK